MLVMVIVVGGVTVAVLAAILVILFRHLRRLADSLKQLQDELLPVLEEIREDSERAQRSVERLEGRRAAPRRSSG